MTTFKESFSINGGIKTIAQKVRAFFSGDVPGYRFHITADGKPLSPRELSALRTVPWSLPDGIAGKIGSRLIGREIRTIRYANIIPTVSRQQMAKALTGNISNVDEIKITHQQLGTGTSTPANSDTALQTPNVGTKKMVSSLAYSTNSITATAFWDQGEATGTWREFGLFLNTSVLFNRISINVTVAGSEALTVDGEIVIS
jgi:hypothetical protein